MSELIIIGIVALALIALCLVGYRIGTKDQKFERDTGRDFASNRDKDFGGGGMYGGGYSRSDYGRPRTRSYDSDDYEAEAPYIAGDDEGDYNDLPNEEPKAPEF